MDRLFIVLAALSGGIGVALGAFGAHGLRARLSTQDLDTFKTGVNYQMYHALALLGVALALTRWSNSGLVVLSCWLFVAGTVLFSGSLYALALSRVRWLGAITPFGGLAFIAGWICLALGVWMGA